jgi:small-conductance mechanosensitive channel
MQEKTAETLKMILLDPLTTLGHELLSIVPNILGAIAILIAGYFIAKISAFIVKKLIEKFSLNSFADKAGVTKFLTNFEPTLTLSTLVSKLIYFIVMITFVMSAAEALKMDIMADALKSILLYLPNILAAVFVLIFGFFMASSAKLVVSKGADGMNIEFSDALGKITYFLIAIITLSLAIGQLEIETALLNQVASIIIIAIGAALALSLGLGTKELSSLILAGNYVRDIYKVGDTLSIDDVSGEILTIGTTKTVIKTSENKEISIANDIILKSKTIKG